MTKAAIAKKEPQVQAELKEQDIRLSALEEAVANLENILNDILRPLLPKQDTPERIQEESTVNLAATISMSNHRITNLRRTVSDIIERCEI
jgi:polyhydroxyalkanoate synthesis regulator phasin